MSAPADRFVMVPAWTEHILHALYDIEDTSQSLDKRVIAQNVRFENARMIVAALNYAA